MSTPRPTTFARLSIAAAVGVVTILVATAVAGTAAGATFNLGVVNTSNATTTLTGATGGPELTVVNSNTSNHAILAQAGGGAGIALYGQHTTNAGPGPAVRGDSVSTAAGAFSLYGVLVQIAPGSNSAAIRAQSNSTTTNGYGLWASQEGSGSGVFSTSASGIGVYGKHTASFGTGAGIQGDSASGSSPGVVGKNTAGGPGVKAIANNGVAPLSVSNSTKIPNLNSDLLDGLDGTAFWKTTGNAGTNPASNFLGTTDNKAFEVHVNSQRALRVEPTGTSPNLIGGFATNGNTSGSGAFGLTIAGGGRMSLANVASDNFDTISGGFANLAGDLGPSPTSAAAATVGGGQSNVATAPQATVGGGEANTANADHATVSGGLQNTASGQFATVAGGTQNTASGVRSFAAGTRAIANQPGTFVWGDSTLSDTTAPTSNSFTVASTNGIFLQGATTVQNHALTVSNGPLTMQNGALSTASGAIPSGSTSPSVSGGNVFSVSNAAPTTITNFINASAGQMIILVFNDGNTTVQSGGAISLQGNTNFNGTSNDTLTLVNTNGMNWFEVTRSVN